jgi:adenine phosphoribosyltransferase
VPTTDSSFQELAARARARVRDVHDFPRPGILFKDITPLLADPDLFRQVCDALASPFAASGVSHVVAVESRGFILGAPIAERLGAGFIPVRKPGKLPARSVRIEYALEYGSDALEMHADALGAGDRALIVDDVLATGGTASAAARLVAKLGAGVAGCSFLIALDALRGHEALGAIEWTALVRY